MSAVTAGQVSRWRKKPVVVEAHQWFKNGDHPADNSRMISPDPDSTTQFEPFLSEGEVVRYFRHPDVPGNRECREGCGFQMHYHGWIDTPEGANDGAQVVCPGDWIVTGVKGERYPCKPDVFAVSYEPADADDRQPVQLSPHTECRVCNGTMTLTVPDSDGEGASEQDCPEQVHDDTNPDDDDERDTARRMDALDEAARMEAGL